jgi:hypothetical protein
MNLKPFRRERRDLMTPHADPARTSIGSAASFGRRNAPVRRRAAAGIQAIAGYCVRAVVALALLVAVIPALGVKAAPPGASFPPGTWKGTAVITGGWSLEDVVVSVTDPIRFSFQVNVAANGSVVDGSWALSGQTAVAMADGNATATFGGTGTLEGTGAAVEFTGTVEVTGSATVQGANYPFNEAVEIGGHFAPTSATCSTVSGDFATEARQVQQSVGFATSMTGPFTAHLIGAAGDEAPGFEDQYVTLVTTAEALLAMPQVPAADVVALVEQAADFYENVVSSADCPGGNPGLQPGNQPYAYFTHAVGELLLKALATNAAGYSTADVRDMALAAVDIGVVGPTPADAALAKKVNNSFFNVLADRAYEAKKTHNTEECTSIAIAADTLGYTQLAADAKACATGA